jgi:hypothetical protein
MTTILSYVGTEGPQGILVYGVHSMDGEIYMCNASIYLILELVRKCSIIFNHQSLI